MLNIALKRSITLAWSVVGMEPMPRAWAASIRFWHAGITELAPPAPIANAKTTHGAFLMSSARPIALR